MKQRSEIPLADKWNVESLFRDHQAWEQAFSHFKWDRMDRFKGCLFQEASLLKKGLDVLFECSREIDKLLTYAHLRHDENTTDETYKGAYQRVLQTYHHFQEQIAWIEPEILSIPKDVMDKYLCNEELQIYRFYLEKIVRLRPHTLSPSEERLLAMAAQPIQAPSKAFGALNNSDLKWDAIRDSQGKKHPLTHGSYLLHLRSSDRLLRKRAFINFHKSFEHSANTLSELIYGQVQGHIFQARARNYPSSLEAALFPKNIPVAVYHNLIQTVRKHLPSLHRYVALRKKVLGLKKIHLYDMYVPLVTPEQNTFSYEQAEQWIIDSVAPLGTTYHNALKEGLINHRWVDRYENAHKRSGAYSSGCYDSFPFILMNYKGILKDVFTLAHEAGHSMHSYLSHRHQPYHDSHYPIFVAEVASTFNEALLMHHLMKLPNSDPRFLVHEQIEDIRGTLFRQTMFAEFELKIHEHAEKGIPLTPQALKNLYTQLNRDYFGPEMEIDPEGAIEWARIPHFYYNFYVYQYATGLAAALALSEKVLEGDPKARESYLTFLKGGGSLFPIDLLKCAGVDMTTPLPLELALKKFNSLVTQLEKFLT